MVLRNGWLITRWRPLQRVIRTATLFGIGTTVFLFTISVQNLIFTNPVGNANPTKQCESLAEGVASE